VRASRLMSDTNHCTTATCVTTRMRTSCRGGGGRCCGGAFRSERSQDDGSERRTERPEPHDAASGASPPQHRPPPPQPQRQTKRPSQLIDGLSFPEERERSSGTISATGNSRGNTPVCHLAAGTVLPPAVRRCCRSRCTSRPQRRTRRVRRHRCYDRCRFRRHLDASSCALLDSRGSGSACFENPSSRRIAVRRR